MKMLENCINSAIIIDDKEDEIVDLMNVLTANGIYVEFHEYKGDFHVAGEGHLKNRNLIFMDLMLNDNCAQYRENISIVISVLAKLTNGPHFGLYGLIVWTKHDEFIKDLKESLSKVSLAKENTEVKEGTDSDDEEIRLSSCFCRRGRSCCFYWRTADASCYGCGCILDG